MNLTQYALKNKTLIYFLLVVLSFGGIAAFRQMSKLEDPEIVVKQALVVTVFPGAASEKVELEVTDKLEKAIRSMGRVDKVTSRSMANISEITVVLDKTLKPHEIEQRWDILRRKVAQAAQGLPEGVQAPIVMDDFGDVFGMFYSFSFDGYSHEEAYQYAEMVQRELLEIEGVRRVELYGNRTPSIDIILSREKMANLGVHPLEVMATLKTQDQTVYPGYLQTQEERLRFSVESSYHSVDDIRNLLIQGHEKDQLVLSNIAQVKETYQEPYRNLFRFDQMPALAMSISMERGFNVLRVGNEVDEKLNQLGQRMPVGLTFNKVFFQPEKVDDAIQQFMINLVESVLIVVVVLMIFMGLKSGLIIGSGLIFTILISFVVLFYLDGTIQRVSLASIIVAMGMLVDNAIVVLDSIEKAFKKGVSREKALNEPSQRAAGPLLGATLIAIFAFLPIFLSPDTTGEYTRDLFIVLAVSLLISWILALVQTPLFVDRYIRFEKDKEGGNDESFLHRTLRKTIEFSLTHKTLVLSVTVLVFGSTIFLARFLRNAFFPDLSYNQIYVEYKMPDGTRIEKVEKDLESIEAFLSQQSEVKHVATSLGGTPSRYNLVRSMAEPNPCYGELIVEYASAEEAKEAVIPLQDYLIQNYPQAYARVKMYNLMYKKYPVEVRFTGPDPAVLRDLTKQSREIMEAEPTAYLVTEDWEPAQKKVVVHYSQPKARSVGISRQDAALAILTANDGLPVGTYYKGTVAMPMVLKAYDPDIQDHQGLDETPVWSVFPVRMPGMEDLKDALLERRIPMEKLVSSIPLGTVVDSISLGWEEPVIRRYNGQRAMRAQCNPVPGVLASETFKSIRKKVEAIPLPEGYVMNWEGEYEASQESSKYLYNNVPLAVVLIFFVLIGLFKDMKKPIILLLSLPVAFVGIILGMLVTGKDFGFVAMVGALGLMGMMIKNGVVLLDEISLQLSLGVEPFNAIVDSAVSRSKPVMMASLTTILGMLPLVNDPMFGSLAVTIMSGLLLGTIIVLVLIPVLYGVFYKVSIKK